MNSTLTCLENRTYKIFHSIYLYLFLSIFIIVGWSLNNEIVTTVGIISFTLGIVLLQFDMRLIGLLGMLVLMSVSKLPSFDSVSVLLITNISIVLGALVLLVIKNIVFKRIKWSFGSIGFSLIILILTFLISSIVNVSVRYGKYSNYGLLVSLICFAFVILYFSFLTCSKKGDGFITKEFYIINIVAIVELAIFFIRNHTIQTYVNLGWVEKNILAMVFEFCIPFMALIFAKNLKRIDALMLLLADYAAITIISSRGGIITIAILTVLVAYILTTKSRSRFKYTFVYMSVIIAVFVIAIAFPSAFRDSLVSLINRGSDISGRDQIWSTAMDYFKLNPFVGSSFQGLFELADDLPQYSHISADGIVVLFCHNTFITLLATGGILSLLAYLFHIFELGYTTFKQKDEYRPVLLYIVLFGLIHGLIDNTFFSIAYMIPYIMIFADPDLHSFSDEVLFKSFRKGNSLKS